jgi:hypothetical protein
MRLWSQKPLHVQGDAGQPGWLGGGQERNNWKKWRAGRRMSSTRGRRPPPNPPPKKKLLNPRMTNDCLPNLCNLTQDYLLGHHQLDIRHYFDRCNSTLCQFCKMEFDRMPFGKFKFGGNGVRRRHVSQKDDLQRGKNSLQFRFARQKFRFAREK